MIPVLQGEYKMWGSFQLWTLVDAVFFRTDNVLGRKMGCSGQWGWPCSGSCGSGSVEDQAPSIWDLLLHTGTSVSVQQCHRAPGRCSLGRFPRSTGASGGGGKGSVYIRQHFFNHLFCLIFCALCCLLGIVKQYSSYRCISLSVLCSNKLL